jgi:MORN repeat
VDGKRHGQGEMVWFNGDRYVGEWKEDNLNGLFISFYG